MSIINLYMFRAGLLLIIRRFVCLFFDTTAPQWARASSFTRFLITHNDAPQSVGLLWTSDQLVAETTT